MKKVISVVLALSLAIGIFCGCGRKDTVLNVHVEGAVFGAEAGKTVDESVKFNADWLAKGNNKKYNGDLAQFAAIISADTYFRDKDLQKGTQNRVIIDGNDPEKYDRAQLLTGFGFTDVKFVESFREKEYTADTNDSVTMTLGYMADEKNDIFTVAIRGCFSVQEWVSVFDPGADSDGYAIATGEHAEWKNKDHFKGVDIAAERAKTFIDEFVKMHDRDGKKNSILFTGHSRGALIANVLGAFYEKNSDAKTYTYTFNCMPVTLSSDAADYKTIFNVLDPNDFYVDTLPFGEETFKRYGRDVTGKVSDGALSDADKAKYAEMFGKLFPDRISLYENNVIVKTYENAEDLEKATAEFAAIVGAEGLALEPLCTVTAMQGEGGEGPFELVVKYNGGALLIAFAKILAYGEAAHGAVVSLFAEKPEAVEIADFLFDNAAKINAGHLLKNTFELAGAK